MRRTKRLLPFVVVHSRTNGVKQRMVQPLRGFLHDLKVGARSLFAARWTTAAAVLILALGTGVNTSVLAVAYGILLRPLPYRDASRIVVLWPEAGGREFGVRLAEFDQWRDRLRSIQHLAACSNGEFTLRGAGEARSVRAGLVKGDFFELFGAPPLEGRAPAGARTDPWLVVSRRQAIQIAGTHPVDAIGRVVTVGQAGYVVAAVLPDSFAFPADDVAVWLPASPVNAIPVPGEHLDARSYRIMGRLAPGATLEQAREDASRVFAEIRGRKPAPDERLTVMPLGEVLTGRVRPVLAALAVAAILVLLVACGNVASLLVGRALTRTHDLAVRLALGATRWHLVRGVLAESLILALLASALGVWIGLVLVRAFVRVATGIFPRLDAVAIDLPVLVGTGAIAFVIALLCGAAPAFNAARSNFAPAFRGTASSASRGARRVRGALVAGQIALSIVLLTGAALVMQTVTRLLQQVSGFEASQVVSARLIMTDTTSFAASGRAPLVALLLDRVRALPGVRAAGIGSTLPPRVSPLQLGINRVSGDGRGSFQVLTLASVTPGYFAALGARVVRGRVFRDADVGGTEPVAVFSESAARHISPTQDPVDRTLWFSLPPIAGRARRPRIVGIVGDIRYAGLDSSSAGTIYLLWNDLPAGTSYLVVRSAGDPLALAPALRRVVRDGDPSMPVPDVRSLEEEILRSIADRRMRVLPSASFAVLALAVALLGLSAAASRSVAERRRELAVRAALGATPAGNLNIVVREAAWWAAFGVVAGLCGAAAAGRTMARLLYGVSPYDPLTFAAVAVLVGGATLGVCYVAARRALRVDVLELLRAE
jgi:putative ABC transport system permease protein